MHSHHFLSLIQQIESIVYGIWNGIYGRLTSSAASACLRCVHLCVCVWGLQPFKVVVLSYPLLSPCVAFCQSQPSDIFRQLNCGTFQCHPLLSVLTGTAQTMMHSHCGGGEKKKKDIQPTSMSAWLRVVFPLLHQKAAFAGIEYHSPLWWKKKKSF